MTPGNTLPYLAETAQLRRERDEARAEVEYLRKANDEHLAANVGVAVKLEEALAEVERLRAEVECLKAQVDYVLDAHREVVRQRDEARGQAEQVRAVPPEEP